MENAHVHVCSCVCVCVFSAGDEEVIVLPDHTSLLAAGCCPVVNNLLGRDGQDPPFLPL